MSNTLGDKLNDILQDSITSMVNDADNFESEVEAKLSEKDDIIDELRDKIIDLENKINELENE